MFSGAYLRQARVEAQGGSLSAAELAERVGASKAQILAYENGLRTPDPPRIRQLAAALNMRPLDLADKTGMDSWQLADLRRASGLRASDLCRELQLKPYSYRRLETTGLCAEGSYGLSVRLASVLGVTVQELERYIAHAPGVRERIERVRVPLKSVVDRHLEPGCTALPVAGDEPVKAVAAHYARSVPTIARILQQEIVTLREAHRRRAIAEATAQYGATAEDQDRGHRRREHVALHIHRSIAALPFRLDTFFRAQLSPHGWESLGQLHLVAGRERPEVVRPLMTFGTTLGPFVRPLTAWPRADTAAAHEISRDGRRHHASFEAWYGILYPWVQDRLRQFAALLETSETPS
ncbi:helix-turn-helix transcriptional regulator [Streptomyces sp. NPDC001027]|uniref:helix-turn-helix transcriptional regulator n=1 Tax=Streptomyces sp. NPDC001027 TaxID=3154771 RepID=UPI00332D3C97